MSRNIFRFSSLICHLARKAFFRFISVTRIRYIVTYYVFKMPVFTFCVPVLLFIFLMHHFYSKSAPIFKESIAIFRL